MAQRSVYSASRIFTGDDWLPDHAVIVKDGVIESLLPAVSLPKDLTRKNYGDAMIAPAFIDVQVYGAAGKLLAAYPVASSLDVLVQHCRQHGTAYCLPTVATTTREIVFQCIDAVRDYRERPGNAVLGLHLEGPWISPAKRGVHPESLIHAPTIEEAKELLDYGRDVIKMITLAPEVCTKDLIDLICSYSIVVAAGHSNASYKEAMEGFDNGITTVTHLYNAMSGLQHRAPGLVGAAMNHERVTASIIPDGHHVDYAAIVIAKQLMKERLFAITDAVTETTTGTSQHSLLGDKYESNGTLSGSALTMQKALYNLVNHADIETGEALRMCSLYPAKVLGLDHESGRIKPGYKADMVVLNKELEVKELI